MAACLGVAFPELNDGATRVESVLREEEVASHGLSEHVLAGET